MKGEEKLWDILSDKLETLRASKRLPEAIRVAETLLELAKRTFGEDDNALAVSYEKLGQLLDQSGDLGGALGKYGRHFVGVGQQVAQLRVARINRL